MKALILSVSFAFAAVTAGYGWGSEGHQAIGVAGFQRLNSKAKAAVRKIMNSSQIPELQDVTNAATWPDDIRQSSIPSHSGRLFKAHNPAAEDFDNRFQKNSAWHFANYPLGATYTPGGPFSDPEDAAHMIKHFVEVLEGTAQGKWAGMRKDEALAWLIHVVGDIHQPLHVGEGFYDYEQGEALLVTDPTLALAVKTQDDRGANDLFYTKSEEFHAFWDKVMVSSISPSPRALLQAILAAAKDPGFSNSGDYHQWSDAWATATIAAAKEAYAALVTANNNRIGTLRGNGPDIDIKLDAKVYQSQYNYLVKQQLGKAAYDLSELLNHIHWK